MSDSLEEAVDYVVGEYDLYREDHPHVRIDELNLGMGVERLRRLRQIQKWGSSAHSPPKEEPKGKTGWKEEPIDIGLVISRMLGKAIDQVLKGH